MGGSSSKSKNTSRGRKTARRLTRHGSDSSSADSHSYHHSSRRGHHSYSKSKKPTGKSKAKATKSKRRGKKIQTSDSRHFSVKRILSHGGSKSWKGMSGKLKGKRKIDSYSDSDSTSSMGHHHDTSHCMHSPPSSSSSSSPPYPDLCGHRYSNTHCLHD